MPFDAKQIIAIRQHVKALSKKNAVSHIAHQKEKVDIVFVICAILDDLAKVAVPPSSKVHFDVIKKYFDGMKEKLTASRVSQGFMLLSLSKETMLNELNKLSQSAELLEVSDINQALYSELFHWLHGLYEYTAQHIPEEQKALHKKNADEFKYLSPEEGDSVIFAKIGLTFYHAAVYYEQLANKIEASIQVLQEKRAAVLAQNTVPKVSAVTMTTAVPEVKQQPAAVPAPAPKHEPIQEPVTPTLTAAATAPTSTAAAPTIAPVMEPREPVNTQTVLVPAVDEQVVVAKKQEEVSRKIALLGMSIEIAAHHDIDAITIKMPHDEAKLAMLLNFLQAMEKQTAEKMTVTSYLLKYPQTNEEEMVRTLKDAVCEFELTPQEEVALRHQMGEAISYLKRYASTPKYYVFSQTHTAFANKAATEIEQEPSVRNQILLFFKYYDQTIGINGNELLAAVKKSLVFIYNRLIHAPLTQEVEPLAALRMKQ